ncbi:MAG: glycine betaine ABC transporter substrate-binding protein [Desulfitobacteriia bacterium]|jgi:osmoprotectant transport system substrate-binding protein
MKKKILNLFMVAVIAIAFCGCGSAGGGEGKITVGSKNYTENIVLAHIMAELIEAKTDLTVERKVNLGGSNVAWKALENNDIQLHPEYTGTIVSGYFQEETSSAEETLVRAQELANQSGFKLLEPFGMNNTYTLAVTKETAEKYNLKTFSDLARESEKLILGCDFEFIDRADGYPGLQRVYNMNFKEVKGMDHGIKYRSQKEKQVDVIDAFATDGQLKVHDLVILEDDKEFFPPYHGLPIIRQDTLEQYPELEEVLKLLAGIVDDSTMQELNALVDEEGMKAETVARDFLVSKGLI